MFVLGVGSLQGAPVPELINYQGELKDSGGTPIDGVSVNLIFRFYDQQSAGNLLLTIQQTGVSVDEGIFNVLLGSGLVTPTGYATSLSSLFEIYSAVWMSVNVNGDGEMAPRKRIASTAFAFRAQSVSDGAVRSSQLATDAVTSAKIDDGTITGADIQTDSLNETQIEDIYVLNTGDDMTGTLDISVSSGNAISAQSTQRGGYFKDTDGTGEAFVAEGQQGIIAKGSATGGYFYDSDSTGTAYLGYGNTGVRGEGSECGGRFLHSSGTSNAYVAADSVGIQASGTVAGGQFENDYSSGFANLALGDYGLDAAGTTAGGRFQDASHSGLAYLGYGDIGVHGEGNDCGGYFVDLVSGSEVELGKDDYGVYATGSVAGGYFKSQGMDGWADVAVGNVGIQAGGSIRGGWFKDIDDSGEALVANSDSGIMAHGNTCGGRFYDDNSTGQAYVGYGNEGIRAYGSLRGGYFYDTDGSGYGYIGTADTGGEFHGNGAGVWARDDDSGTYGRVGYNASSTQGNGSKDFVQNHPKDPSQVIVYSALEGDEVGTYTRGTARLVSGEARVALGETFQWVTHPDIGLTVHLTPVGGWSQLYVAEKSTEKILVKSAPGSPDVTFDYIVHGLRVGFEEKPLVIAKDMDAPLPSMEIKEEKTVHPEGRQNNALARFKAMAKETYGSDPASIDLTKGEALKAAIGQFVPQETEEVD